jgi:hypothetical protein
VAITTLNEVKSILNITTTDNDDWITTLIPQVEDDYLNIRGKPFELGTRVQFETLGLSSDEDMGLTIGEDDYVIELKDNDTAHMIAYRVYQQMKPSVLYKLSLVNASSSSADVLFTEKYPKYQEDYSVMDLSVDASANFDTTITKMETFYPTGAEQTAAQMISYQMDKPGGVQSESLGDYSVTYAETGGGGYPRNIMSGITRFVVMQ